MKFLRLLLIMLLGITIAACTKGSDYNPPATATTYSISGTVTGATGVTITLSGASSATTTTAADGSYSFAGLANGSYTVTPSLAGYAFNPTSTVVSVSGANVTGTNFTATAAATTYSISGTVSGAASSGVTITLSGANTGSVQTGAGGTYTISSLAPGSYTVTPSLSGFTFSPTSSAITIAAANSTANNFTATAVPVPHSISGTVGGVISAGVTITVTGTANATTTTSAGGAYTVTGLYDGNYTVTPSLAGYTFTPISTSVTMSGVNVTGTNFTSAVYVAPTYTLSGAVTGPYVEGVIVTLSGAGSATTTTNASGNYSFANLPAGTYTVTPSLAGYTYSPAAPSVAVSADTTQNFVASSAVVSYSISGTVSYAGAKTGPVYLRVNQTGCTGNCSPAAGTLIAAGSGTYTIRGLQPGSYVVNAEMDALGTGEKNANNPAGNSATATIAAANLTGVNITVADPAPVAAATPTGLMVFPSSGAAFVVWDQVNDVNGTENVSAYKVYWGTDGAATNGPGSPVTVPAQNDAIRVLSGLADGALNVKVSALNGAGTEGTPSAVLSVTIGNSTAGPNTVSGTVSYTGSATGSMLVGLFSKTTGIYFTLIASPSNSQGYSVAGVPNGSYSLFAVIDMNGNGVVDAGDISNTQDNTPTITVAGNSSGNDITLSSASATARVDTNHQFDGTNHSYDLNMQVGDGTKRVAAVTLVSGANMPVPLDMGKNWNFQLWQGIGATSPTVGDGYMFKVTFSDGTTQNFTGSVTAVLGMNSLAQSLAVQTTAPGSQTVPLFTWAAPASPPASYVYYLNLSGSGANWNYPQDIGLPSTTTQALYNADGRANPASLAVGTPYTWQVQVRDANGNMATRSSNYTP